MRLSILLHWDYSRMLQRFIGEPPLVEIKCVVTILLIFDDTRFKDIGYNHVPFYNCPNSPKCRGCTPGQFYAGESWLQKEDCRPNWFKYVGTG